MKKNEVKTAKIGGRMVPLTKSGLPNRVYLTKDERAVVDSFVEKKKKAKKDAIITDLGELLESLKID